MKKNLITVIILALVLANLILTAILVFTIIPQTKKSNQLIDQVCSAINGTSEWRKYAGYTGGADRRC